MTNQVQNQNVKRQSDYNLKFGLLIFICHLKLEI